MTWRSCPTSECTPNLFSMSQLLPSLVSRRDEAGHEAVETYGTRNERDHEDDKFDRSEQAQILFPPRPEIEDRARHEEHGHQQYKFEPGGHEHEERVDDGDPREDLVSAAFARCLLIAHAAAREQHSVPG